MIPASFSASHTVDVEKAGFSSEHVVISVSGMTCTGCETMLRRSLASLPSIKNVKTSLILSRAECDVNLSAVAAMEAIRHVEKTTKFKCCRITDEGSVLDIIPSGNVHDFLRQETPWGVTSIERVDKTTVRVCYDAKIIGARRLLKEGFHTPAKLAPPRADPALAAGSRHVCHVGYMTLFSSLLTIPVLFLAWAPLRKRPIAHGLASLVLATIVQVVVAGPFYVSALKTLVFSRMVEMDLLIVLSTSAAYVFSVVSFGFGHWIAMLKLVDFISAGAEVRSKSPPTVIMAFSSSCRLGFHSVHFVPISHLSPFMPLPNYPTLILTILATI
jgi:Cu2+-exporting ATPase